MKVLSVLIRLEMAKRLNQNENDPCKHLHQNRISDPIKIQTGLKGEVYSVLILIE